MSNEPLIVTSRGRGGNETDEEIINQAWADVRWNQDFQTYGLQGEKLELFRRTWRQAERQKAENTGRDHAGYGWARPHDNRDPELCAITRAAYEDQLKKEKACHARQRT